MDVIESWVLTRVNTRGLSLWDCTPIASVETPACRVYLR